MAVVSNNDTRLNEVFAGLGIRDYFEQVVVSSQAGFVKPAAGIYKQALLQLNSQSKEYLQPSHLLMVGVDLRKDVHAARNVGIQPIYLDRDLLSKPDPLYVYKKVQPPEDLVTKIPTLDRVTRFLGRPDPLDHPPLPAKPVSFDIEIPPEAPAWEVLSMTKVERKHFGLQPRPAEPYWLKGVSKAQRAKKKKMADSFLARGADPADLDDMPEFQSRKKPKGDRVNWNFDPTKAIENISSDIIFEPSKPLDFKWTAELEKQVLPTFWEESEEEKTGGGGKAGAAAGGKDDKKGGGGGGKAGGKKK
eukprot:gnl/Hemi2/20185_TR6691_c0_g1_i1.p1 gnl/Hemi2/20185_TR6691_c0_g1~~gnl/Hemi2/20185_TR6691_c0_g1_i1.p1  ORF type:complete len:304 (+),score=76.04 gnl/Hemi2/20185_TR6691_c0_g1_i1:488-1399(+)